MPEAYRPKGLSSAVCYQDAKAAFRWLEEAFGFEPLFVLLDAEGNLGHSEMTYGNSVVMVGNEWSEDHKSPKSIGGKNSQRHRNARRRCHRADDGAAVSCGRVRSSRFASAVGAHCRPSTGSVSVSGVKV